MYSGAVEMAPTQNAMNAWIDFIDLLFENPATILTFASFYTYRLPLRFGHIMASNINFRAFGI
jgi:hypothetical protein